jgi:Spy/CpxP family protein refolding chaperone
MGGVIKLNKFVCTTLVLLLFLSVSFAQNTLGTQNNVESGPMPSMSKILNRLIVKANTLDLTEKQRERLSMIQEKYVFPLAKEEAEYNISRMKVVNIIQDPNFNPAEAKRATKTLKETALEMSDMLIDGLVELRAVIGIENYKMITSRVKMQ